MKMISFFYFGFLNSGDGHPKSEIVDDAELRASNWFPRVDQVRFQRGKLNAF